MATKITAATDLDSLSDDEYAELERACDAEEHPLGDCPLCAVDEIETTGTLAREYDGRDHVSDLWGGWTGWDPRKAKQGELAERLVKAHRVVRSFVDTFATGDLRYDVTFDESIATAGTDVRGKKVVISPAPALDTTITPAEAGTILTGMSVHEASHVRYGRRSMLAVRKTFAHDAKRAHALANILEDVRIEQRFSTEYPGYAHVFAPTLAYVAEAGAKRNGGAWRPTLGHQVDLACAAIRYPAFVDFSADGVAAERDWWQAWAAKWSAFDQPAKLLDAVREALAHVDAVEDLLSSAAPKTPKAPKTPETTSSPETSEQGDESDESDESASSSASDESDDASDDDETTSGAAGTDESDETSSDDADASRSESGDEGGSDDESDESASSEASSGSADDETIVDDDSTTLPSCAADGIDEAAETNGVPASSIDGRKAQSDVNEAETLTDSLEIDGHELGRGEVRSAQSLPKPKRVSTYYSDVVESKPVTAAVRAALMRSRSGHTSVDHGQLRGRMDNRSLARIALNDARLFHRRKAPSPGRYLVWLLVDRSSSMSGRKTRDAIAAVKSIASAAGHVSTLRMQVHGWTTSRSPLAVWGLYRCWSTGEALSRIDDLGGKIDEGGTPDAAVLAHAIDAVAREAQPGEQPVVVMLSDGAGYPASGMRRLVEGAERKGVRVVSVAIASEVRESYQQHVYGTGRYVRWSGSISETAAALGRMIARVVSV